MSAFLLDTCVISEGTKKYPNQNVVDFLQSTTEVHVPAGALMELQMGIAKVYPLSQTKGDRLTEWYNKLKTSGSVTLAMSDVRVMEVWGRLGADNRLQNLSITRAGTIRTRAGQDLHIAAAAIVYDLPIATYDVKDFMLISSYYPLPGVYNPMTGVWHRDLAGGTINI